MNRQDGFTLVELLVALTVSMFMLASLSWVVSTLGGQLRASEVDGAMAEVVALRPIMAALIEAARHDSKEPIETTSNRLSLVTFPPQAMGPVGPVRLSLSVIGRRGDRRLEGWLTPLDPAHLPARRFAMNHSWDDIAITSADPADNGNAMIEIRFTGKGKEAAIAATPKANASANCVFDPISMACR